MGKHPFKHLVEIRGLSRRFGACLALANVDWELEPGIVYGLVGENAAGKTTLIKHLLGLLKAQTGSVRVFGMDPVQNPPEVLGRIGYLSEERDMPDWMRVSEFLRYCRAFYPSWDDELVEELQKAFELPGGQKIKTLSRGQRARVGLLAALAHRPDLLVLDEPSSGLDPVVRRDILAAIIRTVADEGRTVLFSSHLLDEVERVADHVAMIHQGRMVLCDSLESLSAKHRRLTICLNEPVSSPPELPGAISVSGQGRLWSCIANGDLPLLKEKLGALGAEVVDETFASLEEVFVARIQSRTVT